MKPDDLAGFTNREIRLARALYKSQELLGSIYLNLGKKTIPVFHEMQDSLRALTKGDGALCNYVGPLTESDFAEAMRIADDLRAMRPTAGEDAT